MTQTRSQNRSICKTACTLNHTKTGLLILRCIHPAIQIFGTRPDPSNFIEYINGFVRRTFIHPDCLGITTNRACQCPQECRSCANRVSIHSQISSISRTARLQITRSVQIKTMLFPTQLGGFGGDVPVGVNPPRSSTRFPGNQS